MKSIILSLAFMVLAACGSAEDQNADAQLSSFQIKLADTSAKYAAIKEQDKQLQNKVSNLEVRVEILEKQASDKAADTTQGNWVLWEDSGPTQITFGLQVGPPSPISAFTSEESCLAAAQKKVFDDTGGKITSGLQYPTEGATGPWRVTFRCLPVAVDPRKPQ